MTLVSDVRCNFKKYYINFPDNTTLSQMVYLVPGSNYHDALRRHYRTCALGLD